MKIPEQLMYICRFTTAGAYQCQLQALHLVTLPESAMQHDIAAEGSPVTGIARMADGMLSVVDPYRLMTGEVPS